MKILNKKQAGVSIVEIMVSLVINSLVMIAVIQLFGQNKATYIQQDTLARMQENGRFALDFITRDLRYADFWGCVPEPADVTNNVVGANAAQFANGGLNGTNGNGPVATDAGFATAADTLSIARASSVSGQVVSAMTNTSDPITIGFDPTSTISVGDTLTISNCRNGDIFTVTGITGVDTDTDGNDDQWLIAHAQNDSGGTQVNNSSDLSFNYDTTAALYTRAVGITYDIGTDATGVTGLRRNGLTIIPEVETMQIIYGEDTDSDGVVNRYIAANDIPAGDFSNVVSVRFSLLVRTEDEINSQPIAFTLPGFAQSTPIDNRSRRIFTATATIRNRVDTATL